MKQTVDLEQAYALMDAGNYQDTVNILLDYLRRSPQDYEAQYLLARAYSCMNDFTNSFIWCKKAADEGKIPAAQAFLAIHYCEGVGVKKSGPDASHYIKLAIAANDPDAWNSIHLCQGIMCRNGIGVDKDVPKAYKHFKQVQGIGLADEYAKAIEESYPITAEGKIDLKRRKRSKWATFFLWVAILINLLFLTGNSAAFMVDSAPLMAIVVNILFVALPFFVLFWQSWAFWGMLGTFMLSVPLCVFLLFAMDMEGSLSILSLLFANTFLYLFSLLTLLIHKKGYCQPWYALMKKEDTGCNPVRRVFARLLRYGEGDAYKIDASQTKMFSMYHYTGIVLISVLAACGAWGVAQNRFGLELEWNIFNSTRMWTVFSIIGFFLQFLDWTHMSFERGVEVTYSDNSKKFYKSNDIMDNMEGSFFWPLLCHLFLIPMMYGAMIYYVLMGGLALIGGVMPYVLALLVLGSVYFYYKWGVLLRQRKYRIGLLVAMSALFALLYIDLADNISLDFGSGGSDEVMKDSPSSPLSSGGEIMRFEPGHVYMVEGEIEGWKKITGRISVNKDMNVLFFSDLDCSEAEDGMYGYVNGDKLIIDGEDEEIEGTITDKITGTWKMPHRGATFAFTLRITGSMVSDFGKVDVAPSTQNTMEDIPEEKLDVELQEEDVDKAYSDSVRIADSIAALEIEEAAKSAEIPDVAVETVEDNVDKIYENVDVMPEYPGGSVAMIRFISQNLKYPTISQENGVQGRVIVRFTVGRDGSVYNVRVIRGVDVYLDKEAVRIVSSMPPWTPGMMEGKPVNVDYTVPINFRLQ